MSKLLIIHPRRFIFPLWATIFMLVPFSLVHANAKKTIDKIVFSEAFDVLAANGKLYSNSFSTGDRVIPIRAGNNRFVLQYEEVFEGEDNDDFDIVKSSPFIIEIYLSKNHQYRQTFLHPSDAQAAKKYKLSPSFVIKNEKGNTVSFLQQFIDSDKDEYLMQVSRSRQNTATIDLGVNPKHSQTISNKLNSNANSLNLGNPVSAQPTALSMLEYWWSLASDEEKQRFLKEKK